MDLKAVGMEDFPSLVRALNLSENMQFPFIGPKRARVCLIYFVCTGVLLGCRDAGAADGAQSTCHAGGAEDDAH